MAKGAPKKDPEIKKIQVGYRLPAWMVAWMRSQNKTQNELIETALIKQYNLKPPE